MNRPVKPQSLEQQVEMLRRQFNNLAPMCRHDHQLIVALEAKCERQQMQINTLDRLARGSEPE